MRVLEKPSVASPDPNTRIALAILQSLFGDRFAQDFSIAFWDGTQVPAKGEDRFTLRIATPGTLRLALRAPIDLNAGRALAAGLLEVDGNAECAIDVIGESIQHFKKQNLPALLGLLLRLPKEKMPSLREARLRGRVHSAQRDREAIGFHYDQPVEFYRSFLGEQLVYSCAYFDGGVDSLEQAQNAKIDYVLRKLRLAPGDRLLDIGCGWGALVVRAAKHFGARVVGVTLSRSQCEEAQARIEAEGLAGVASVQLRDYRELADSTFDKISSIGMVEHVGRSKLPEYFRKAYALLRPGGLFLNHGIADQSPGRRGYKSGGFIERFVFPDGELLPVSDSILIAERSGFEIRDVENLREHYMRTLRAWVSNLEAAKAQATAAAGLQAYRTWRIYMAGSAQGFRVGRLGLFQSLLAKPLTDGSVELPATRRDLYRDHEETPSGR
ncbi:MAG: class I SAM-dependent methyltransferase [Candidatus Eremiobacteraeota bacterium]|nr:class I SAM-dependent methyltransferase [Candidatus Eremiobacteraeota bacterium]